MYDLKTMDKVFSVDIENQAKELTFTNEASGDCAIILKDPKQKSFQIHLYDKEKQAFSLTE